MIFNVDFCRFRVPYFQTCAPYFVWGVGFSLDRVLALGICQSQGWIQYWNLSIHQSSSVWMGSQARLSCGNSEMMGLGHQDHQIREVQLEILIASIVNLARYCFDMNRNLRTLVSVGRTESCTMFLGSLYNPCPGSIQDVMFHSHSIYTLYTPYYTTPFPGIVPSGCTILRLVVWNMSSIILHKFADDDDDDDENPQWPA